MSDPRVGAVLRYGLAVALAAAVAYSAFGRSPRRPNDAPAQPASSATPSVASSTPVSANPAVPNPAVPNPVVPNPVVPNPVVPNPVVPNPAVPNPVVATGGSAVRAAAVVPSACPADMVLVEGSYCTEVAHRCKRWLDDEKLPFARCGEYETPARCTGSRKALRYCIDRYEYTPPNESLPLNYASFVEASRVCGELGKRICTEDEWVFACEGEEMRPYPYGFSRAPVCNQDREDLYEMQRHKQVLRDHRHASGRHADCKSPFGVYDLAGNLDEPVLRESQRHAYPFRNALKGGWWMAARNRCRPATTAHDDHYKDIQVGVRCCRGASE